MSKNSSPKDRAPLKKGSGEVRDLTAEELAELEAYEASQPPHSAEPESRAARLTKLFYETPEGKELRQTAGTINDNLNEDDTVPVQIQVPRQFIRMTEFLEAKRVAGTDIAPRPPEEILNRLLLNELHGQLHALVVAPATFEHYRKLWNRFCEEQGAPEERIGEAPDATGTDEGPF